MKLHMPLSPAKAAQIAEVSRSLISKAVKAGTIKATRNNRGHIQIERPDLEAWMQGRMVRAKSEDDPVAEAVTSHTDAAKIAGLEVEVREVRVQLADKDRQIDRLEGLLEKALEVRPVVPDTPSVGLFKRIFGRSE